MLREWMDCFALNPYLRYLPCRFLPLALGQLNTLRKATQYRPRIYCVPDDFSQPIAAFDTLQYQIRCTPGSYLWALRFCQLTGENTDLQVQVTDDCTAVPLHMDFIFAKGYTPTAPVKFGPVILTQPRLIAKPGLVSVEIANRATASRTCQLILMFAEPCDEDIESCFNWCKLS